MENKGLLFIPDISGFTRFVSQTEIEHSRLIIQELLEIIINANEIGLEVSEVEGDAILFYKFGECPELEDLYKQVSKMFCEFHRSLIAYDHRRFCQCKACTSTIDLTLKVITHYGEFTGYNVKNFNKLIGKDIIVAHQLLKNDIEQHEYWLVTKDLLHDDEPAGFAQWMKWNSSVKQTEGGEIPFHYTQLGELKNELTPETFTQPGFSDKVKVISVSNEYDTDIITLFHATGDYNFRARWQEGVRSVEEINHFLPRLGMRCRCIMDNGETVIFSTNYSYHPDRIEFTEADEKNKSSTRYLLEKTGDNKTKLTVDYYITKGILAKTIFNLTKKKQIQNAFEKSLVNLKELVKEIHLPG
jgi:hypothetical protein